MSELYKSIYHTGTKIYRYLEDGTLLVARIYKYDKKNDCYKVNCKDEKLNGSFIQYSKAHNEWIKLNPDGIVSFSILKGEKQDVMVAIHRADDLKNKNEIPFAVCRQDVVDIFKMYTNPPENGKAWAGISVNRNNCPAELKIEDFMLCDDILYTRHVSVYLDDTLDDILSCIYLDRYDNVLKNLEKFRQGSNIIGIRDSVKDLLETHNFMYDFHETFEVTEVPFPINNDNVHFIKDVIGQIKQKVISNVFIIPYDKSVNTSEFNKPYMLMTPDWTKCEKEDQKIFIVGYDIDDSVDYLTAKYGTNNKDEIIKQLGFNVM